MLDFGILGINQRNLNFIKKFNPDKAILLVNNKIKTKEFLQQRGIPTPKTLAHIQSEEELKKFDFASLNINEFVIKPNNGSKGKGVWITQFIKGSKKRVRKISTTFWEKLFQKKELFTHHFKTQGEKYSDNKFKKTITPIFDGIFSINSKPDSILIEEKLVGAEGFERFCEHGLADIRIICFNLVPVAAMVRVPTPESKGKANLAQGGIGLGVEIGEGSIKTMYQHNAIYESNFPEKFKAFANKKIPFWNDILMYSSQVQYFMNMGYIGIDRVITADGPKLLEVNGRAGVEIQKVCALGLKKVLEKIDDMKIHTPEKGVEIAKSLFTSSNTGLGNKKIIYSSERATLNLGGKDISVITQINFQKKKNLISRDLMEEISTYKDGTLTLHSSEHKIKHLDFYPSSTIKGNIVILSGKSIQNMIVNPQVKIIGDVSFIDPKKIKESELEKLQKADKEISILTEKLNFSGLLRPINYLDELDKFVDMQGEYNPRFKYSFPTNTYLNTFIKECEKKRDSYFSTQNKKFLKSAFGNCILEKFEETIIKAKLIMAYKKSDFKNILKYNQNLFGGFKKDYHDIAWSKKDIHVSKNKMGKFLTFKELKKRIQEYLRSKEIRNIKIEQTTNNLSRISLIWSNTDVKISLLTKAKFREKELEGILAHEIDAHLMRYIYGSEKGRALFKNGTAGYLIDEEGIAMNLQTQKFREIQKEYEPTGIYQKYLLCEQAGKYDFQSLCKQIKKIRYPNSKENNYKQLFKAALKMKKGIKDTSIINPGAVFLKNKVYLDGYLKISKWIEEGGDINQLIQYGKIKIEDLKYLI